MASGKNRIDNYDVENIRVFVLVSVYNAEQFKKCVESSQNQLHKNLEIILVDDSLIDDSEKTVIPMRTKITA